MGPSDAYEQLVSAYREQQLCEQALENAKSKAEQSARELEQANDTVTRCQERIARMARGEQPPEVDDTIVRGNGFIPVRR